MGKKRTWKAHVIDFIKEHDKCPGDMPPTGHPDALLSDSEFMAMATAAGLHKWDSCHFVEEILGLGEPEGLKELKVDVDTRKLLTNVSELTDTVVEVSQSKRLVEFQDKMKTYIDRIQFKGGKLRIPAQLLKFAEYANKFFNQ
jgi:hypothetical protein